VTSRLGRYRDIAWFVAKYGRADFVTNALNGAETASADPTAAEMFAKDLESLGPTFIKLGQILSTRADLLPPAYLDALARLQDKVEPFAYEDVERTIREELGTRVSHAFGEFDKVPIAAASLGQVHRALLRGGREVAVKVQRPGIREQIEKDLSALHEIAVVIDRIGAARNVDAARVLEEFRRTLMSELDYREEARNLITIAHRLRDFPNLVVPLPIDDFTTARVLTMDYIAGTKITLVSRVEWTEVDGAALADEVFRAYLQQILIDGVFHADPHPGNVLLTPDRRIALIDLGMIGRISSTLQEQLFKLILAIGEGRADEAADVLVALGERHEEHFSESDMRRAIADLIGRFHRSTIREMNVGRVMLEMSRKANEHGLKIPPELVLLGKTLLHLDEVARLLDSEFDVTASLRRNSSSVMRRRMLKTATPANVFAAAMDVREFAERLPGRVNRILDALAANDLRFKVEVIDQGSIIDGLQKVANRIALGLVLAALIVGAAMLMRIPTSLTIFGYPWIAMLLFLAAAAGGFWMAWTILAGDVRKTRAR
jgi:predicted unusual protein kinase regulating ubiquinone biosynthesis (AarF/ABC1/UbiB family)